VRKLALVAAFLALLPLLAHRAAPVPASEIRPVGHHVRGALHVHTGRSHDGRGSLATVVAAARKARLDFIVITDHNVDAPPGWAGRHDGVLVITGQEKSSVAGHALVLGIPRLPFVLDGDPDEIARDARDLGGFVVVAHPRSSHPGSRWRAGLRGVAGIEVINLAEPEAWPGSAGERLLALPGFVLDQRGALLRSLRFDGGALALLDEALAERPLAALLGSDAHGGVDLGPLSLPVPSHERVFSLAAQHLLLSRALGDEAELDSLAVLEALRRGHGWAGLDGLADASGFSFEAESGGRRASMGDGLPLLDGALLRADVAAPPGTQLVLLRNGREIARGARLLVPVRDAGAYRVEAYLDARLVPGGGRMPWILSNAISLFPAEQLSERAARAESLPEAAPFRAQSTETLDGFESAALRAEWQVDARALRAALSLEAGALRFDFALGPGPRTHAAVCEWRERDLSGARGLLFRTRASRLLRFDVQLRTADSGGRDGVRIWRRSIRASGAWEQQQVAIEQLKSYDARGGTPDLSRVRGIYFHVDEANLDPGQSGTLWLDDVRIAR
jgi:hypothetical protein